MSIWFDAYDNVGGAAQFDTAALSATASPAKPAAGSWSTNGAALTKAAALVGGCLLLVNLISDRRSDAVEVPTVPAVTVAPAPVAVLVPTPAQPATALSAPSVSAVPSAAVVVSSGGFGDLMENVCGNASTGYRMCRGSKRNPAQVAANWPPS